jgi:hypothetical protein
LVHTVGQPGLRRLWTEHRADARYPDSFVEGDGPAPDALDIVRLVLDHVLEIDAGDGFISGPAAWRRLFGQAPVTVGKDISSRLSLAAIRHASSLDVADVSHLTSRLYWFNAEPASAKWRRRLPSRSAIERYLDTEVMARDPVLAAAWERLGVRDGFIHWRARRRRSRAALRRVRCKLYVTPRIGSMPGILERTAEIIAENGAIGFKIGADLRGLLRPDKMVIYHSDLSRLSPLARQLASVLAPVRVCGVPFSAALAGDGLVSWGIDPETDGAGLRSDASWRYWICRAIAAALLAARAAEDPGMEPWEFAMRRISLEGVDTETWRPLPHFGAHATGRM